MRQSTSQGFILPSNRMRNEFFERTKKTFYLGHSSLSTINQSWPINRWPRLLDFFYIKPKISDYKWLSLFLKNDGKVIGSFVLLIFHRCIYIVYFDSFVLFLWNIIFWLLLKLKKNWSLKFELIIYNLILQ